MDKEKFIRILNGMITDAEISKERAELDDVEDEIIYYDGYTKALQAVYEELQEA